jgi:ATP synthase F1 delta subunit
MQEGTIGRRYARALALALVGDTGDAKAKAGQLQKVEEELRDLAALFLQKGDLREAMLNPSFSIEQRREILKQVSEGAALSTETRVVLDLLVQGDRLRQLPAIARAFQEEVDERTGRVRATVSSAKPLDAATMQQVVKALEKKTGKAVLAEAKVDPSLIAGVSARIGGIVYDSTVRSHLERLRQQLASTSL